ncbi:DNA-directed RNA polymerase II [Actinoplanes sp. G11-F43]|uniref:DNA-directed RNA polymerase II n=1 Tax=Actinoplanes sp. G11-F43 TaxID=3424130 RepID=UPI003D3291DD
MPEQPQWSERTLDMPPQDPWAEEPTSRVTPDGTAAAPTSPGPAGAPTSPGPAPEQGQGQPDQSPFSKGRARVTQRTQQFTGQFTGRHEPTGTGWPEEEHREPPRSLSAQLSDLRRGGEWSSAAVLFAFVCWGIWSLSSGGDLGSAFIIFVVTLLVAVGVFALARLVGRLVLEQRMGRRRHTARGAHVVAGVFLAGVGFAFLRQTDWVMTAVNWVTGSF